MNLPTTARKLPRETVEGAYRRGYAAGYMVAINDMANKPHRLSMMHLLEEMLWFWETDLLKWQSGDCTDRVLPPQFTPRESPGSGG
jgi:hypothetical protein